VGSAWAEVLVGDVRGLLGADAPDLPRRVGLGRVRVAEQWAAGQKVDRARALEATYTRARRLVARTLSVNAVWAALAAVGLAAIAGTTGPRLAQYAVLGAVLTCHRRDPCSQRL
jgi:hypothetical protein